MRQSRQRAVSRGASNRGDPDTDAMCAAKRCGAGKNDPATVTGMTSERAVPALCRSRSRSARSRPPPRRPHRLVHQPRADDQDPRGHDPHLNGRADGRERADRIRERLHLAGGRRRRGCHDRWGDVKRASGGARWTSSSRALRRPRAQAHRRDSHRSRRPAHRTSADRPRDLPTARPRPPTACCPPSPQPSTASPAVAAALRALTP
jgi:hypothetical protein